MRDGSDNGMDNVVYMDDFTGRDAARLAYYTPAYTKAIAKVERYISFWYRVDIASMMTGVILAVIEIAIATRLRDFYIIICAVLTFVSFMYLALGYANRKWLYGYEKMRSIIDTHHDIIVRRIHG